MRELGAKDFKINSIHFPKSIKELAKQEAVERFQTCTLLGEDPLLHMAGLRSSRRPGFPRIPFKCKALVGGRYATLEGSFKIKELSKAGQIMETSVVFPDGISIYVLDKMKIESGDSRWETNLPSISADPTLANIWMNTAGQELKMACMKFALNTDPKSLNFYTVGAALT